MCMNKDSGIIVWDDADVSAAEDQLPSYSLFTTMLILE